jgi:SSS family solute:Na+ symporter
MILALIPYLQLQFAGVGIVITLATGGTVSVITGIVVIAVVVSLYTWLGGMKSVAWVDTLQGVLLLGAAFIGGLVLLFTVGGGYTEAVNGVLSAKPNLLQINDSPPWNWFYILTFSAAVFFGWIFHPHMWLRIHYFKNGRAIEALPAASFSIITLITVGTVSIVLAGATAIPNASPDQFILVMFRNFFPTVIFAVIASAALAAMMSSASSQCHGIGAVVSRDISQRLRPEWSQSKHLLVARITTILAIIAAVLLAFAGIPFLLTSGGAAAALATALFAPQAVAAVRVWKWPTKQGAIVGSSVGFVVNLLFLSLSQISTPVPGIWEGFWGVVANILLFIGVSILTSSHPENAKMKSWRETFRQPFLSFDQEQQERGREAGHSFNDD